MTAIAVFCLIVELPFLFRKLLDRPEETIPAVQGMEEVFLDRGINWEYFPN
jgi:hypothetical protein